ncbi:MAG: DUF3883 domain-containing protein [bacterium]
MSYNPDRQYRCTIIRGKAKNAMEDLLPAYSQILISICPCSAEEFPKLFNNEFARMLPGSTQKTLSNHRTEIAGKLFGMYFVDEHDTVHVSPRTLKLAEDHDLPAFFKDICYRFQFPNGMDKITKIRKDLANHINIRQGAYILELIRIANEKKVILTVQEIAYYVLNSLDVLQRKVNPPDVLNVIIDRRNKNIEKRVPSGSKGMQHIRETLNYLELANLVRIKDRNIILNSREDEAIKIITSSWDKGLEFNVSSFDVESIEGCKRMYKEWGKYYASQIAAFPAFSTTVRSLTDNLDQLKQDGYDVVEAVDTTVLGDEGELYVYNFEKKRVKNYNTRLAGKVLLLSKTKGLGFDIQSVRADKTDKDEYAVYIEVKATKRVTAPAPGDSSWLDVVALTRNEWVAASQKREAYFIYRVYFTPQRVVMFAIQDPISKSENGTITIFAEKYRVEFNKKAGVFIKNE